MPGQACAYKIGMLKILDLRAKAQKALGPKFSIKEFHNVVLQTGNVPLAVLEHVVDDWIAEVLEAMTVARPRISPRRTRRVISTGAVVLPGAMPAADRRSFARPRSNDRSLQGRT